MNKPRESINWEKNNYIEQSSALFYQLLTGGIETIILLWNWIYMTTLCIHICMYLHFIQEQGVAVFFHPLVYSSVGIFVSISVILHFCKSILKTRYKLNTGTFLTSTRISHLWITSIFSYIFCSHTCIYDTLNNNNKPSPSNQWASNLTKYISETQLIWNNKVVIAALGVWCQHHDAIKMLKIMHNLAHKYLNPLTPGAFCFLDILAFFRLDFSQISFNLVENAFATQQPQFLAT